MTHFKQVMFTISKEHDIYIDEVLLDDKRKDKKEFPNGRSEYIRKLINDDMSKNEKTNEIEVPGFQDQPRRTLNKSSNEEKDKPYPWKPEETIG